MVDWGASLAGFGTVMSSLEDIAIRYGGNVVYVVGTNVEYAVYQEFGTSKMPAQPYLLPAARKVDREMSSIIREKSSTEAIVKTAALRIEAEAKRRAPVDTGNLRASITAERVR